MAVTMTREQMSRIEELKANKHIIVSSVMNGASSNRYVKKLKCLNDLSPEAIMTAWVAPEKVEILPQYEEIDNVQAAASYAMGEEVEWYSPIYKKWCGVNIESDLEILRSIKSWRRVIK